MDTDVIIVGAGPVGLMLAGELRLGGARVTVLERLAAPTTESRASTLHARTMELLDQRGLLETLGTPPNEPMGHFGGLPLDLSEPTTRYPGQWKVPQARVEELLAEWATGLGAEVRREHELLGVTPGDGGDEGDVGAEGVEVEVATPDGVTRLTAGYLVGCDGEESTVRRLAGFDFPGSDATKELLRCDVLGLDIPNRRFQRLPNGVAIAATRDGVTRVMVHEFGREVRPRTAEPEYAEIAAVWARVTGEDITHGTPTWLNAFGNTSRQAASYRRGRVLLAGDAAHRQMPVGGQALNLGLQDAANLGWKLAARVTGRAPDGLLDTYHTERHAVGRRVLANIEAQTVILFGGPETGAVRGTAAELLTRTSVVRGHLAGMISGLDIRYGDTDTDTHPDAAGELTGRRVPHIALTTADGPTGTTELLRPGRGVLLDLSGDTRRRATLGRAAEGWAGRVDVVSARPVPGTLLDGQKTVLLRPDGHIAWSAPRAADPAPALRRWFGAEDVPRVPVTPIAAPRTAVAETAAPQATAPQASAPQATAPQASAVKAAAPRPAAPKPAAPKPPVRTCDVLIVGAGLAGSVSAAILARQGKSVVLVDSQTHPRMAIGESMTPQLIEWLHILAVRFDLPELLHLLDHRSVTEHIGPTHGKKQSFGFVKHDKGQEPDPRETTMFVIPKALTQASHLFRQDTDAYYFHVAAKYGATTRQHWRLSDLDFDDDGVTVTGQNGEVFRARYLIDASGHRSLLAEKFGLREQPARFKHHSRSLFTHYIGVKPFDDVSHHPESLRPPKNAPWSGGTLHHLIERGWFWIIPFNNHKGAANPVTSVGLTMDERVYPRPRDISPEQEFTRFLDQYPAVKRQFEGATRVREWVSTDRLQYSSKESIGYRWCLMSHAAGFLDPLFSRGLSNTFEVVHSLMTRLLPALDDDDFAVERFGYVDRLERGLLHYNDELVNSAYISFGHFRLWNAVFRVWGGFATPGVMRLARARINFTLTGDPAHLDALEDAPYPGLWWPEPAVREIVDLTAETCEKYEAGQIDGDRAADIIFDRLRRCELLNPAFGWRDPEDTRLITPTTATMAKFMYWAVRKAPPQMRDLGSALLSGTVRAGVKGKKVL
ncbi:FAD-dependent monooxygenase [Streptomyces sp. NPDC008317]|uniref:FAD-dependent monooxygenase n=1 Tax=Streptomyces sp. NPDC008317 TaxID=3364827 RepID=UPI0036E5DBAE